MSYGKINSSPFEPSTEARLVADFFPVALRELLEFHAWTFATKRETLAELVNDRQDWAYRYALPADCVKPRRVLPVGYADTENDGAEYEWEGTSLYTNAGPAMLVYTFLDVDFARYPATFKSAMSYLLASYLVGPIVKDPSGRTQAILRATALQQARAAAAGNANATRTRATYRPTALRAR